MKLDVVEVTREIVNFPSESLTSNVACTRHSAGMLRQLGFEVEDLPYTDANGVEKLSVVARLGKGSGGLALMSHNDVVPADMEDGWTGDPYEARVSNGRVIGRGSADMKGPLAASICAAARFKANDLKAPLYIVITADEEISGVGARMVTDESRLFAAAAEGYGIVCEPTRLRVVYAHKAGMSFAVTAKGKPAHTSTLRGVNANLKMIPFLQEMAELNELVLTADRFRSDEFDPPHSELTISVNDHNVAMNISPARSVCRLSYRCMPGVDAGEIVERVRDAARRHRLDCRYSASGSPVYTPVDSPWVRTALRLTGTRKARTVPFGTDGIHYVRKMKRLLVLGPGDIAQAHTADEWIEVDQLRKGVEVYSRFIDRVCVQGEL